MGEAVGRLAVEKAGFALFLSIAFGSAMAPAEKVKVKARSAGHDWHPDMQPRERAGRRIKLLVCEGLEQRMTFLTLMGNLSKVRAGRDPTIPRKLLRHRRIKVVHSGRMK